MEVFIHVREKNRCKNGRILLTLAPSYRKNGKVKQKHVEVLGYLDELEKIYPDPIAHFQEIARQHTGEEARSSEPIQFLFDPSTKITDHEIGLKTLAMFSLKKFII
ncbi:MAG: hypothetical protein GX754_08425 [Clostridiaceae bacterium]|nr:hypothetical protein [Clostridiaceae bacterium]